MAITQNALTSGALPDVVTGQTTASVSPTGDRLVFCVVGMADGSTISAVPITVSGGGMTTWNKLYERVVTPGGSELTIAVFYAMQSSPGSGTITMSWGGSITIDSLTWSVFELAGVNTSATNGAGAIRTLASKVTDVIATSISGTMAEYGASANGTVVCVIHEAEEAHTPATGYAEIHDVGDTGGTHAAQLSTGWRNDNNATYGASWTTSKHGYAIGIEIVEASEDTLQSPAGELDHLYLENNTVIPIEGEGEWSVVGAIPGGQLKASTKYLLMVRALITMDDLTDKVDFRVQTDDDSAIETKSLQIIEYIQAGTTDALPYFFPHSFTTGSTPGTVVIEADKTDVATTARVDQTSMFLLALTSDNGLATEGTDYHEDIQARDEATEYSATRGVTKLAEIAGSDLGTVEHWIVGYAKVIVGSTGRWFEHQLWMAYDTATQEERATTRREGEDTAEEHITGFSARHKASSGTPNVTIFGQMQSTGGMDDGGAYLIAIPTSKFTDFFDKYEAAAITANGETTIATTGSYTPTEEGNHLIFGMANGETDAGATTAKIQLWMESTTTEIRTGDSAYFQTQIWDTNKSREQARTFQRYGITTAETFNLQGDHNAAEELHHRWIVLVNLATVASGTTVNAGLATETDTALAVTVLKVYPAVGLATETDTALAAETIETHPVLLATESDTAFGVTITKDVSTGLATETDTALAAETVETHPVLLATETDTALAVVVLKVYPVLLTTETDTALAIQTHRDIAAGLATETDSALSVSVHLDAGLLIHFASMIG